MKRYTLAIASWVCFGAMVTEAQYYVLPPGAGLYFRAGVGPSFYQEGRLTDFSSGGLSGPNSTAKYETGIDANVAVGWAFNRYVSADFETGFQGTRIDSLDNPAYTQYHSDVYDVPFLGNVTLSCPIPRTIMVPYIGAGAGGADTELDAHSFGDPAVGTAYGREDDVVFAWQAFAGLQFRLAPNMTLGVAYRYFTTADTTYSYPPSPNLNAGFDGVRTHSILFTFEWKFW